MEIPINKPTCSDEFLIFFVNHTPWCNLAVFVLIHHRVKKTLGIFNGLMGLPSRVLGYLWIRGILEKILCITQDHFSEQKSLSL